MPVDKGSAGGPLIDFIQDVVRRLTKKGISPSSDTISRDIKLLKSPDPTINRGEDLETCGSK